LKSIHRNRKLWTESWCWRKP